MKDLHHIRSEYAGDLLDEGSVNADPLQQFEYWFSEALIKVPGANAMILATADGKGTPAARVVLLKTFDHHGFVFYTNYESNKGKHLAENPKASLLFYWPALHQQVRIEGVVKKTDAAQSAKYFSERPRGNQLSAWISQQSREVTSKEALEAEYKKAEKKYKSRDIPCPPHWGGYCLAPHSYEFWQGQAGRLHDRVGYSLENEKKSWTIRRLAP